MIYLLTVVTAQYFLIACACETDAVTVTMASFLVAAVSGFSSPAASPRRACSRGPAYIAMQQPQPDINMTSAFASALAASPDLRQYAAKSAERAAAELRNSADARPGWDAHLRLYPRKRTGWARVERAAELSRAYWELVCRQRESKVR